MGLASLPLWLEFLLIVAVPTVLAACGPLVVRRFIPVETLIENNDVAGFKFATLGVVYAVLLGLAVISVWEKFADAETAATREAATVISMMRLTAGVDETSRQSLRTSLSGYANAVVASDWPAMANGEGSVEARAAADRLYAEAFAITADDPRGAAILSALLTQADNITEARRERIILAQGVMPGAVWLVLLLGATATIGFTYFFAIPNLRAQSLMTGVLAFVICLALFVAVSLDHPFTGAFGIKPEAMHLAVHDIGEMQ